jgi:ribosomal protein S21
MRTLTTDQLDDLYQSFKRDVPLKGYWHTMTITEYYNKVWRKRKTKGNKQHEQARIQRCAASAPPDSRIEPIARGVLGGQ